MVRDKLLYECSSNYSLGLFQEQSRHADRRVGLLVNFGFIQSMAQSDDFFLCDLMLQF